MHKLEKDTNDTDGEMERDRCPLHTCLPGSLPRNVQESEQRTQGRTGIHAGELPQNDHRQKSI